MGAIEKSRIYIDTWGCKVAGAITTATAPRGVFDAVSIGPNSDAYAVELRPRGRTDRSERLIVSADSPHYGQIDTNDMLVYPIAVGPDISGAGGLNYTQWQHVLELEFYKGIPPQLPRKRANKRWELKITLGNGVTCPALYVPTMGRKRAAVSVDATVVGAETPQLTIQAYRTLSSDEDYWQGAGWRIGTAGTKAVLSQRVFTETLVAQTFAAAADYNWEFTSLTDFLALTDTGAAGGNNFNDLHVLVEVSDD